ncbi:DUF4330 domain-containing protein [Chakrabartyella piscis]|uniref:DUF4330 domain-containing protein n=1 Tax=Chakrabartyella piscis TaxID=2918914 RepID=UPI002958A4A1|nr:DUF4330 domain-containing protein [Chakrabartyella piscis]
MRKIGKLNVVDILIILAVILVLVGGGYYMLHKQNPENQVQLKSYTYVVEGQEVVDDLVDMPVIGQNIYNSSTSEYLGVLTGFDYTEHTEPVFDYDAKEYQKVPSIGYSDVTVEVTGYSTETDADITVEGTVVKVGKELNIKGKGYAFKGIVIEVRDGE